MPLDRRQHDRVRAPRILVRVPTLDKLRTHYLHDLSAGGLFVRAEKTLPIGTEVDVELVPPGLDRPLTLHARVARLVDDEEARLAGNSGMGVKFENLTPEADRALAALIAECLDDNQPLTVALRTQVQSLALELAAARQYLAERDAELEAAKRKFAAAQGSTQGDDGSTAEPSPRVSDLEDALLQLRRQNENLRGELDEARSKLATLQRDYAVLEQDEATTRALAERLAMERSLAEGTAKEHLQRLQGELDRMAQEQLSAVAQLNQARAKNEELERSILDLRQLHSVTENELNAERSAFKEMESRAEKVTRALEGKVAELGKAEAYRLQMRELQLAAETQGDRASRLERQVAEANSELERSKERERDLRRLLNAVSSDANHQPARPESNGQASSDKWTADSSGLSGAVLDLAEPTSSETTAISSPTLPSEKPPAAGWVAERFLSPETDNQAMEPASLPASAPEVSLEDFNIEVAEPPAEIPAAPAEERVQFENNLKVTDFSKATAGRVSDFADFQRRFLAGAKVRLTDRFHLHTPTDPYEVMISGLLESTDDIRGLRDLAGGRASDQRIAQVVFRFYLHSLVDLADGLSPPEVAPSGGSA